MINQIIEFLKSGEAHVVIHRRGKEILEIELRDDKAHTKILDLMGVIGLVEDLGPEFMELVYDINKKGYGFKLK